VKLLSDRETERQTGETDGKKDLTNAA